MAGEITVGGNILASHTGVEGAGLLTLGNTVAPASPYMFRNKLINGNFDFWQRGTSQTSNGYGSVDRFYNQASYGSAFSVSQQFFTIGQTDVPGNPRSYFRNTVTSADGGIALSYQKIENVRTLSGQTVTVSFWAKADSNLDMSTEIYQNFGSGGTPSSNVYGIGATKHNLTTSWQKFTTTAVVPSISDKTLGTNGNHHLGLAFWFDSNSTYISRTDSLGQQSGTFDIAQIQLEEGPVATPFEQRPYSLELSLCQRYFEKSYEIETSVGSTTRLGSIDWNFGSMTSYGTVNIFYKVTKRATPTVKNYDPDTDNTIGLRYWNGSAEVQATGSLDGWYGGTSSARWALGSTSRSNALFHWTADAEL
ncbi:MAG: hypothetical protein VW270_00145 [Candidatus Poseidoniales archaeon]